MVDLNGNPDILMIEIASLVPTYSNSLHFKLSLGFFDEGANNLIVLAISTFSQA